MVENNIRYPASATACAWCGARQRGYCEEDLLDTRTEKGSLIVRPTNCPRTLGAQKTEQSKKVQEALQELFRKK